MGFGQDIIDEDEALKNPIIITEAVEEKAINIKDTLVIFNGADFYYWQNKQWELGTMVINDNINIGLIPENCSIVSVQDSSLKLQAKIGHVIITGGYYNGSILN